MKKALDYTAASTAQLETWLKQPRGPEDARKIREELANRGQGKRDTGTMELALEGGERKAEGGRK